MPLKVAGNEQITSDGYWGDVREDLEVVWSHW